MRYVRDLHQSLNDNRRSPVALVLSMSNRFPNETRNPAFSVSGHIIIVILKCTIPLPSASQDDITVRNIGGHHRIDQDLTEALALNIGLVEMRSQALIPGMHKQRPAHTEGVLFRHGPLPVLDGHICFFRDQLRIGDTRMTHCNSIGKEPSRDGETR
jgi:hypothetical protein